MLRCKIVQIIFLSIAIILAFAGCAANVGTHGGAPQPYAQSDLQIRQGDQDISRESIFERATAKPALAGRVDRKYGSPPALPEVPAAMERLEPLSASATIQRKEGRRVYLSSLIFSRSRERVHAYFRNQQQEWLFLRNTLDGRRASGLLIDHHVRAVLEYPQSDLLDAGVANGWAEVMAMGLSLNLLNKMHATGKSRSLNGITFYQYLCKDPQVRQAGAPDEVWWSREYFLPLKVVRTTKHGKWIQELTQVRFDANQDLFKDPLKRFPKYTVMDNADWSGCDQDRQAVHAMGLSHQ